MSTKEQVEGASLDAQKDAIAAFASQNNITIVKWFEEHQTAAKTGRLQFDAMMRALRHGKADGVVMHRIDRSSRNYADWARLDEASKLGIKIYFAADSLDFDSRGGRLMADIQMVFAADYSRNLSIEVKKGIYGRIKHGFFPFRAPIGYLNMGEGEPKIVDPAKAPLVKQAFALYCTGEYSITSLTDEMARRGLTGWAGRPVVRRNIDTMLRNPFYLGKMLVCGKLYDAIHDPLITAAQFQRVKTIKAGKAQKKSTKHQLRFRNLLRYADCERTLTGERQKTHIYYRCHTSACPSGTIREDRLETQLIARLQQLQIPPEDQDALRKRLKAWLRGTGAGDMESSLRLRIADASTRQDRLTDLLVDGTITQADFEVRKQNTAFELERLRAELKQIAIQQKTEADLDELLELAVSLAEIYQIATPSEQRAHIKNCAAELLVRQGVLRVQPAGWLKTLNAMARDPDFVPDPEAFGLVSEEPEQADNGVSASPSQAV